MPSSRFSTWPCYSEEEVQCAAAVIRSNDVNYWTGQEGRKFENEFAAWTGASHAIALTNGTVALDLALHGLGIGSQNGGAGTDEVIVTPRTFIASVSCVVNAGAIPVFADVDNDSGNLSAETISAVLTPCTKGVIVVHLAGWPCGMDEILELAERHNLKIIEDCAQAHGARISGRAVGTFGDVGAWSFCQDKIMTTGGEGGMVTTKDEKLWSKMWSFKDHGKSWDAVYKRSHQPGFRWLHESFGTNWRMLETQAAIGRLQLQKMAEWTEQRTRNALAIAEFLAEFSDAVRVPAPSDNVVHAYYRQYAYVKTEGLNTDWTRDRIVSEISSLGVPVFHGTCSEVYLEKAFDQTGWRPVKSLPVAKKLGQTSLMFLTHPTLTSNEINLIGDAIRQVLTKASV